MSKLINISEKKIYQNKPENGGQGQYNYGRVNSFDSFLLLSQKYSNAKDTDTDLYADVVNWSGWDIYDTHPHGWLSGRDSNIGYEAVITSRTSNQTDKETWYDMEWSMYMYDAYYLPALEKTGYIHGNHIRDSIHPSLFHAGHAGLQTDNNNTLAHRVWGYQYETDSIVHHIYGSYSNDALNTDVYNCQITDPYGSNWCGQGLALPGPTSHIGEKPARVKRFHLGAEHNDTGTRFNWYGFQEGLRGVYRNQSSTNLLKDNIIFITRTAADEKEKSGGKYRKDERDRIFAKTKVRKSSLYNIWKNQRGESKLFYHNLGSSGHIREAQQDNASITNYNDYHYQWRDNFGDYAGRSENKINAVNPLTRASVRVNAPIFNHHHAILTQEEGGANAAWVDTKQHGWWCLDALSPDYDYFLNEQQGQPQVGLNPRFGIDSTGWPDEFYSDPVSDNVSGNWSDFYTTNSGQNSNAGTYFNSSRFKNNTDFRPISHLSSSFDVDLQSYYDGSSNRHNILNVLSSAPNSVKLQLRLTENTNNLDVEYLDLNEGDRKYLDYWFYVVNWNWKDGDPGGGDCEQDWFTGDCLQQLSETFPKTNSELEMNLVNDLYDLKSIHCNDPYSREYCNNWEDDYSKTAQHSYINPGIKIVKAISFATLPIHGRYTAIHPPGGTDCRWENDTGTAGTWPEDYCAGYNWGICSTQTGYDDYNIYTGDKNGCLTNFGDDTGIWLDPYTNEGLVTFSGTYDYINHVQAVNWKLITIRINLTDAGAFPTPDFADIGGDDYTFLPYPDVVPLDPNVHGYPPSAQGTTSNTYKSSHPVISGLSEDSTYANSVNTIIKRDQFSSSEATDKQLALKAKSLNPGGSLDEFGKFLGKSDIAQVRIFNTSETNGNTIDMNYMLGIDNSYLVDENFHPYNDFDYWTGGSEEFYDSAVSFPKESPVGDIFIDEYDQFRDMCLFELNCGILDGKTIIDTSGNSNKGILFGDFSVKKEDINQSSTRDSYIKVPKTAKDKGAF